MNHNRSLHAPSPDLGPSNAQSPLPEQQGTLPVRGPQPKLHEGTKSWQPYINEGAEGVDGVPSFVDNTNILDPHAEDARQAVDEALGNGEFKPDAREFMDRKVQWPAAVENELPARGRGDSDRRTVGKNEDAAEDIDFWLRTRTGVVMLGGYGEDEESMKALVKERALREGFDPEDVVIITMAKGLKDPEAVRKAVHDKAVVITHSAGATVLQEAFEGEDTRHWLRPGLPYFHNPPSGHRRPVAKPSSASKEMSLPQLIVGSLLVADTDRVSQPKGWRQRWGREVFSRSHARANIKALFSRIVKHGRNFDEFASSLADQDGTQVIIPVSRNDYFFHINQASRDTLGEHGATVVEPQVGDGYHNSFMFDEFGTAHVDEELARMAMEAPDSQLAKDLATRQRHAALRRDYRRRRTHRETGVGEVVSRDTPDRDSVDAGK